MLLLHDCHIFICNQVVFLVHFGRPHNFSTCGKKQKFLSKMKFKLGAIEISYRHAFAIYQHFLTNKHVGMLNSSGFNIHLYVWQSFQQFAFQQKCYTKMLKVMNWQLLYFEN